jgi:hypothetical protein
MLEQVAFSGYGVKPYRALPSAKQIKVDKKFQKCRFIANK